MKKDTTPRIDVVYDYKKQATDTTPATVWVRIYHNRTRREYLSTHVRVLPSEWSDRYHVIRRTDAAALNKQIQDQVDRCTTQLQQAVQSGTEMPTTAQMRIDTNQSSFLDFLATEIELREMKPGTRAHHRTMLRSLEQFGRIRRFEDVTEENVRQWFATIRNQTTRRQLDGQWTDTPISQAAVHNYWKRFCVYIHIAIRRHLLPPHCLGEFTVRRGQDSQRTQLTDEELQRLITTPMPSWHLAQARDRFLVQCGTGLSFADLMDQDWSTRQTIDGMVVVSGRREKTGKEYFIIVLPFAVEILERWGWTVPPIANQTYNRFIKQVVMICNIYKRVTTHVGRHTYACYCLRHGVRIEAVQRTLGHTRISTTQIYARLVDMDVVDAFRHADLPDK